MRLTKLIAFVVVLPAIALFLSASITSAQKIVHTGSPVGKAGAKDEIIRIRDVGGEGERVLLKTPEYASNMSRGKAQAGSWGEAYVIFDTDREWIDEIILQYYVLCRNPKSDRDPEREEYNLFKGAVSHVDVSRGRGHKSAMYLRPSTIRRYGAIVAVAVEVLYKGEVVASQNSSKRGNQRLPDEWWKSPKVSIKDGYLISRNLTPFAFINYDDFEEVR